MALISAESRPVAAAIRVGSAPWKSMPRPAVAGMDSAWATACAPTPRWAAYVLGKHDRRHRVLPLKI